MRLDWSNHLVPKETPKVPLRFLFIVALILCTGFVVPRVSAQDKPGDHNFQHHEYHEWYSKLKQPFTGYGCCSGEIWETKTNRIISGDCRPTRARQDANGNWYAIIDGQEVPVPHNVILTDKSAPDGNSHICATSAFRILCFVPGKLKM